MRYEVSPKYRRAPFVSVNDGFIEEGSSSSTPMSWPEQIAALVAVHPILDTSPAINTEAVNDQPRLKNPKRHQMKGTPEAAAAAERMRLAKYAKQAAQREATGAVRYRKRTKPPKSAALVKGTPEAKARMAAIRELSPFGKKGGPSPSSHARASEEHNILASPDVTAHVEQQLVREGFSLDAIRRSISEWGKLVR